MRISNRISYKAGLEKIKDNRSLFNIDYMPAMGIVSIIGWRKGHPMCSAQPKHFSFHVTFALLKAFLNL